MAEYGLHGLLAVYKLTIHSSSDNYTNNFKRYKQQAERNNLNFTSNNKETYNAPFTFKELEEALGGAKGTAAGPDDIHYLLIEHFGTSSKRNFIIFV